MPTFKRYNINTQSWETIGSSVTTLSGLADISIQGGRIADGDVLAYDSGTSKWVNTKPEKADWNESDSDNPAFILNKPTLGSAAYTSSSDYAPSSHTHTGFLTSSSQLNAANLNGTVPSGCYTDTKYFGTVFVETAHGTTGKVGTVELPYILRRGNCFILYLKNNNTVAGATLDINSTGAKPVYVDDVAVTATNWKAGTYLFYYDGEKYYTYTERNPFKDSNTTYTIATGDNPGQIKVTPAGSSAYNVSVNGLGSAAYTSSGDYAISGHTHQISITSSNDTSQITLAHGNRYKITAGGSTYVFTMPNGTTGGDSLPSQSGNSGKFLTTDGSDASWANIPTELPSTSGNSGKILAVNSNANGVEWITNSGGSLPPQTIPGTFLTTNGNSASWTTISATPSSNNTNGYYAGSITIGSGTCEFIICPARAQIGNSKVADQGVIRPYYELNLERFKYFSGLDGYYTFDPSASECENYYFAPPPALNDKEKNFVYVPITTVYHINTSAKKFEAIPYLVVDRKTFSEVFAGTYGEKLIDPPSLEPE